VSYTRAQKNSHERENFVAPCFQLAVHAAGRDDITLSDDIKRCEAVIWATDDYRARKFRVRVRVNVRFINNFYSPDTGS